MMGGPMMGGPMMGCPMMGPQPTPREFLQNTGSSLAYSGGLWFLGLATSAAGFVTVGNFMRRVAVVQGFGQVAMGGLQAYQNPEIQSCIQDHTAFISVPVKAVMANGRTRLRHKVEDMASSKLALQLESTLESMPSCLPRARRLASSDGSGFSTKEALCPGTRVTLTGLTATAEYNGRLCNVVRFDRQRQRYVVRVLPGVRVFLSSGTAESAEAAGCAVNDMKLVKRDNLVLAPLILSDRAPKTATQFM